MQIPLRVLPGRDAVYNLEQENDYIRPCIP